MKSVWEELDAMNELPKMTTMVEDVNSFLYLLPKQQEEQKLSISEWSG